MKTFLRVCVAVILVNSIAACTDREVLETVAGIVELRCAAWVAPTPEDFLTQMFAPATEETDGQFDFAESIQQVMQFVPALCALSEGLNTTPKELINAYADLLEKHPEYFSNASSTELGAGPIVLAESQATVPTVADGEMESDENDRLVAPEDVFFYLDSSISDVGIHDEEDVRVSVVRGEKYMLYVWRQSDDVEIGPYNVSCANSSFTYRWNGRLLEPKEYRVMDHNCHISLHVNNPFNVEWQIMLTHTSK